MTDSSLVEILELNDWHESACSFFSIYLSSLSKNSHFRQKPKCKQTNSSVHLASFVSKESNHIWKRNVSALHPCVSPPLSKKQATLGKPPIVNIPTNNYAPVHNWLLPSAKNTILTWKRDTSGIYLYVSSLLSKKQTTVGKTTSINTPTNNCTPA